MGGIKEMGEFTLPPRPIHQMGELAIPPPPPRLLQQQLLAYAFWWPFFGMNR